MFRTKTAVKNLPLPPLELRRLVGPVRDELYDNPKGKPIYRDLPRKNYRSVLDFGCGCGRLARQLIQQTPQPEKYIGVDIHRGMIDWCQKNLTPHAPQFHFEYHDVYNPNLNPAATARFAPLPAESGSVSLAIAHSVFTHLLEDQVGFYLHDIARILAPDGVCVASWFLFDKSQVPMLAPHQHSLFVSLDDPTQAVIYDQAWVKAVAEQAKLTITKIAKPTIRGFHWFLQFRLQSAGWSSADFPVDDAPVREVPL